jgi:hypothetical protein
MARIGYWVIKYSCDLLYSWSKRTEVMGCGIGFQPVIVRSYRPAVLPAYQSTVGRRMTGRMPLPHYGRRSTGRMPIPPREKNDRQDASPTLRRKNDRQDAYPTCRLLMQRMPKIAIDAVTKSTIALGSGTVVKFTDQPFAMKPLSPCPES